MTPATITPEAAAVLDSALKLSATEREAIALRLIDSVRPMPNSDADWEYWKAEIVRRVEDVRSGRVTALTAEESLANVRKALEEARRK